MVLINFIAVSKIILTLPEFASLLSLSQSRSPQASIPPSKSQKSIKTKKLSKKPKIPLFGFKPSPTPFPSKPTSKPLFGPQNPNFTLFLLTHLQSLLTSLAPTTCTSISEILLSDSQDFTLQPSEHVIHPHHPISPNIGQNHSNPLQLHSSDQTQLDSQKHT